MMHILWSERAFIRRQAVEDYVFYSFGRRAHAEFIKEVNQWKTILRANPQAGQIEPLLDNMGKEYRHFIVGNLSKGIYYVEGDFIYIVDWWDTRRAVENLKEGLD